MTETCIVTNSYWCDSEEASTWEWSLHEEAGTPGWVFINQCPYLTNDYRNDTNWPIWICRTLLA
ncbi:MAG: hypothetical protein U0401_17565 [Anaerolineae bacterium]